VLLLTILLFSLNFFFQRFFFVKNFYLLYCYFFRKAESVQPKIESLLQSAKKAFDSGDYSLATAYLKECIRSQTASSPPDDELRIGWHPKFWSFYTIVLKTRLKKFRTEKSKVTHSLRAASFTTS
jgi:hypothetical protein